MLSPSESESKLGIHENREEKRVEKVNQIITRNLSNRPEAILDG